MLCSHTCSLMNTVFVTCRSIRFRSFRKHAGNRNGSWVGSHRILQHIHGFKGRVCYFSSHGIWKTGWLSQYDRSINFVFDPFPNFLRFSVCLLSYIRSHAMVRCNANWMVVVNNEPNVVHHFYLKPLLLLLHEPQPSRYQTGLYQRTLTFGCNSIPSHGIRCF